VRDEYYFGLFWSGMPDLNYENPAVLDEMKRVARFWLDSLHVDGFRLDAVRHLVEAGDQVSNTPGTHAVLRDFGQYLRSIAPQSYTIGEVWDNTDVILTYYPDQLDAYFAFPISEALIEAVKTGKTGGLLPTVEQFQRAEPAWRWAPFQRNHDQTRTMTALGDDTAGAKLAATILLTLPGVPFVYYGEEIGMTGDKPDERLRTPMQWSRTSSGFTTGTPWEAMQPDSLVHNVGVEDSAPNSLLKLYRWLIRLRAGDDALRDGELTPVETGNESVLAYLRGSGSSQVLVIANLSAKPAAPFALPGRYSLRSLLHPGANRSSLPTLAPRTAYVYEIKPRP
jgi:glycosidase